jgi:hypothetical protein
MNQHQSYTLSLVYFIKGQCFYFFRAFLGPRLEALGWSRHRHAVHTHHMHAITPNSICAEPPGDGRVTPETCRGIDS